ncbi:thermonuclease family protein [Sphingomonas sp. HF-S4]|uniref:Thermonuclease family protein n=1 Tax=Sphingomonas agrestis TaxID=3080540 RepID=A0ABU3YC50_9SPHN|nr:thermonuclease family protein [Sphingomonas sp. HF-S4]MDV3458737.1 thermonuclease family protein [Sphingomonas sp. HF-S4]
MRRASRRRRPPGFQIVLIAVIGLGGVLGATWGSEWPARLPLPDEMRASGEAPARRISLDGDAPAGVSARFGLCPSGGGTNCVVDGDTFWFAGERIRIADIDAPETHPPRCAEEARLGKAATQRLHALLNQGPVVLEIEGRDTDRYGRKLRMVTRGGRSLGDQLVSEGLARPWTGRRQPWC